MSKLCLQRGISRAPPKSPPKDTGKYSYPPNLFLTRDYNIGTTRYYNVPYKGQLIA